MNDRNLKILYLSPEASPFAKVGGLADVAGSLPKALATLGEGELAHDIRLVLPKYRQVETGKYLTDFPVRMGTQVRTAIIRLTHLHAHLGDYERKVPVYLIDNHHYFDREGIYAHHDDPQRFGFFCKAALKMLPLLGFQPDIIHCNDWQTSLIPLYLKTIYGKDPFFGQTASVLTIHNLQYQGTFPRDLLKELAIPETLFTPEGVEYYGQINFLKAGLLFADAINAVSQSYAQEILTPEYGVGLDGLLRKRKEKLYGIINGINYHEFNPEADPRIFINYSAHTPELKRKNKPALQDEVGLPIKDVPVLGLVSRLVSQKGLELIAETIEELVQENIQLVFLGEGDPYYEEMLRVFADRFPDKVSTTIAFNAVLAQRIYAGADLFLMPSAFEPCGLGQLISMRYGTVPIVRSTGGLADTVHDYSKSPGYGNGFTFQEFSRSAFLDSVKRALELYWKHPQTWQELVKHVMTQDFSWAKSAASYVEMYRKAVDKYSPLEQVNLCL